MIPNNDMGADPRISPNMEFNEIGEISRRIGSPLSRNIGFLSGNIVYFSI